MTTTAKDIIDEISKKEPYAKDAKLSKFTPENFEALIKSKDAPSKLYFDFANAVVELGQQKNVDVVKPEDWNNFVDLYKKANKVENLKIPSLTESNNSIVKHLIKSFYPKASSYLKEKQHLYKKFEEFRTGTTAYIKKRNDAIQELNDKIEFEFQKTLAEYEEKGFSPDESRKIAEDIVTAQMNIGMIKIDKEYPTDFSKLEGYQLYKDMGK